MPNKSLPPNPSLDHLKYQAKDLLIALNQGNAEACARAREFCPEFARMSDDQIRQAKLSLADAQLIVAREYGFPSWPKLKHHVEALVKAATSTMASPSGLQALTGPVALKVKWPLGAHIVIETDVKRRMEVHTPVKTMLKQEVSLMSQYAYTVARELPNGGRDVELQHLSFQLEFDLGGQVWRYDSARSSPADESEVSRLFNRILRTKVRYFLDGNNNVERMEGVDELVKRLNVYHGAKLKPDKTWDDKSLDKVLGSIGQRPLDGAAWALRMWFDENYFRNITDPIFLPGKAVQPGDSWTVSHELRKAKPGLWNVSIRQEAGVTFRSWEMRADRLCARLEFSGTEKNGPQVETGTTGRFTPIVDGTVSGVMWFDPDSGRAIESNMERDFKLTRDNLTMAVPYTRAAIDTVTDHHHQVITTRVASMDGAR